jgi:hypothetical protein
LPFENQKLSGFTDKIYKGKKNKNVIVLEKHETKNFEKKVNTLK